MLILSRNTNQSVRIGEDITLTVLEIRDGKVRLGISAPKHVPVSRQEIYEKWLSQQGQGDGGTSDGGTSDGGSHEIHQ